MKFSSSLKRNSEFRRLYNKGKCAQSSYMVVYVRRNGKNVNKIGVTVSNKVGKAVVRNRVRRRLREIYRINEDKMSRGVNIVIVARNRSVSATFAELQKTFLECAKKLGIAAPEELRGGTP